jgi:beta-aspartyl-peptidase (threonine type)
MTPELRTRYEAALTAALKAGHAALQKEQGTSVDAVEAAIRVLEDSPLFNAGVGAVFNREGRNELDAAIMEGKDKKAGAIAGVAHTRNPISLARAVMEKSEQVLLVGEGAERFARSVGIPEVNPVDLWTEERWDALLRALKKERERKGEQSSVQGDDAAHFGTVGAVALDRQGNLAAGTSTGGLTAKPPGRVGDSPIIGAGTYAENGVCGVSCSGHGETFIRHTVAHDVAARLKYGKAATVRDAVRQALEAMPKEAGGVGGMIALDAQGHAAVEFDTEGMYRGTITADGKIEVKIFAGE